VAEEPAQRRLAAILAADVVGYSRLMEADEAGTLAALRAWRRDVVDPLVTKHSGRIFKVIGERPISEKSQRCLIEAGRAAAAVRSALRRLV
jgi:adenylate cyclase